MSKHRHDYPDSTYLQNAIRTLIENIRFASVDKPIHSIVVTSAIPGEGKTTISRALGEAIATGGRRTIIVECDMRRRSMGNLLGVHAPGGLYSVLSEETPLDRAIVQTQTDGLYFLDAEPHIPYPADILSSERFATLMSELAEGFDYVIYDTPPLKAFVDAAVVGKLADGVLLVVRRSFSKRDDILAAYKQLQSADANIIGSVLNCCESESSGYYYYYYYEDGRKVRRHHYHRASRDNDTAPSASTRDTHLSEESRKR